MPRTRQGIIHDALEYGARFASMNLRKEIYGLVASVNDLICRNHPVHWHLNHMANKCPFVNLTTMINLDIMRNFYMVMDEDSRTNPDLRAY
ncbi:hypothetical protein D3C87_1836010 [compost metagenome]